MVTVTADMDGNGEISDTDSGVILHSGCDSPTSNVKDVTTHTRAMKLKNESLQERLHLCLLELKSLCIREAELTGRLPSEYPLLPGEKPPQIRRRIGAAFKLDQQNIPQGAEESESSVADTELALQLKIYEAARKLCHEAHLSKAVKRSRLQQCKRAEKKLRQLQETTFQLRLERGRASPLPAFNGLHHALSPQNGKKISARTENDQGTSDDSSLSDLAVLDEESAECHEESVPSGVPSVSTPTPANGSCSMPSTSSPSLLPLSPSQSPHLRLNKSALTFNSSLDLEPPPIEHSPWTETSLDEPYQKTKKSRSSSKSSPSPAQLLPPLEACLPAQMSHLRLSQSSSTPSTPELRLHRNLSLRVSNTDCSHNSARDRGRARRRLTEYTVALPPAPCPGSQAGADDSHSDRSSSPSSYTSSPCREPPGQRPSQPPPSLRYQRASSPCPEPPSQPPPSLRYQRASSPCPEPPSQPPPSLRYQRASSPVAGGVRPLPRPAFYPAHHQRNQSGPGLHRSRYSEGVDYQMDLDVNRCFYSQQAPRAPCRYDRWYPDAPAVYSPVAHRLSPLDVRLAHSPTHSLANSPAYSLANSPTQWHAQWPAHSPAQWEYPQPCYGGLPRQVVDEELMSWHQRSQFRPSRPRSLDRQGAVRVKNPQNQGSPLLQNNRYQEQIIQRTGLQRIGGDSPVQWFVEDTSEIFSQV